MSKKSPACFIEAPCKVNLHLAVRGIREDGFHEIESLFAALDFGDSLEIRLSGGRGNLDFSVKTGTGGAGLGSLGSIDQIPAEKNLVCRAVSVFREKTGFDGGLSAVLTKRVPLGAGLGGGSSDAASALAAFDLLAGTRLPEDELLGMASALGSDVPFFLNNGGAAWASGRGEKLVSVTIPPGLWVLLVKPDFSVSTAEAFKLLDEYRAGGGAALPLRRFKEEKPKEIESILQNDPGDWPFFNDFLPVLPGADTFREICQKLKEEGAAFAGLSGSGSCCFGLFREKARAMEACINIQKNTGNKCFVKLTFFLAKKHKPVLQLL